MSIKLEEKFNKYYKSLTEAVNNIYYCDGKEGVPYYVLNAIIKDGVTTIGNFVFDSCKLLQSITIPNSVTKIGYSAFAGCKSLKSIKIPDSVTKIGDLAFNGCESLQSIEIPDSVIEIGDYVFHNCNNLTIYGHKDSYIENYAKENNINFEILEDEKFHNISTGWRRKKL